MPPDPPSGAAPLRGLLMAMASPLQKSMLRACSGTYCDNHSWTKILFTIRLLQGWKSSQMVLLIQVRLREFFLLLVHLLVFSLYADLSITGRPAVTGVSITGTRVRFGFWLTGTRLRNSLLLLPLVWSLPSSTIKYGSLQPSTITYGPPPSSTLELVNDST